MTSINFKILLKFYIWTRLQILKTQINNHNDMLPVISTCITDNNILCNVTVYLGLFLAIKVQLDFNI
jgi:hypothetical protein